METIFIEARSDIEIMPKRADIAALPSKIGLVTTVQHVHKIGEVKKALEAAGKTVFLLKGSHSVHEGQALGCDLFAIKPNPAIEAFLYIGTGEFHPKEILIAQQKRVFVYNPESSKFYELAKKDVELILRHKKAAYAKFLSSQKIGVLITTKPGQQHLSAALSLKAKYADKEFFFLVADTFDFGGLMNFPFIECFVNTACPRIGYDEGENLDKPIIDIFEIL